VEQVDAQVWSRATMAGGLGPSGGARIYG